MAPASPSIDAGVLRRRVRLVVADVRGRDLLGLLEGVSTRGADPDRDPIADLQLARRDDGRDTAPPEDEDRARAVAERLVLRLAKHLAQRQPVTALDMNRYLAVRRRRVEAADEEPQRPAGVARGRATIGHPCCRRRGDLRERRAAGRLNPNADGVA